ncbi:hypothetical protein HHK36_017673 [Tetracentron sinense]|uniref:GATA-type domain-containing protein n=1 Tax=Tetracentron sinense TaxID=13715 RepID=A0A835DAK4_TETSI|nr:hypothetical protein HHK36_017673 [Tetracentron sinense]
MKEQNLLRRLELFAAENPDSRVDCTLKLGLSYDQPKLEPEAPFSSDHNIYAPSSQFVPIHTTAVIEPMSEEMKEHNLLRRLELFPGENLDSGVNCTLRLGLSYDQPKPEPEAPFSSDLNIYALSSQMMQNYGVVNGRGTAYSTWGGSNRLTCLPGMGNHNTQRDGFGFFGGSSMAAPGNSNTRGSSMAAPAGNSNTRGSSMAAPSISNSFNNFISHPRYSMPQNNAAVSNIFHRRTEPPEPLGAVKRCTACSTIATPLWRSGPTGAKTLCNACGIRYKKELRKNMGTTNPSSSSSPNGGSVKR